MENWDIKREGDFSYLETGGEGTPIVLLHGLMGALSNFEGIIQHFRKTHNVVIPLLPIFDLPLRKLTVTGLVDYVENFVEHKGYGKVHVLGNSLGGHIAQLYTMKRPDRVKSMTLTGSSGLFESAMGSSFPKRGNYEYIKKKAELVFYDPAIATKELVDEIFDIVNNRNKAIRIVATAKSAVRHNLGDKLHEIKTPTLLIWGQQDEVTPAWVGEKFHELIPESELHMVEKCGHAPMMERPGEFNRVLEDFLNRVEA